MVLVEEYYYEVRESTNVSIIWKSLQIIFYICAGIFGIWSGFLLDIIRSNFRDSCHLYGDVVLRVGDAISQLDSTLSDWGSQSLCEFCQYSMVSSFIFAAIWGTFFLMCGHGDKTTTALPQPWRIVVPAIIFNLVYCIIAMVAAVHIHLGTKHFCEVFDQQIKDIVNTTNRFPCQGIEKIANSTTLLHMNMSEVTSWFTAVSWLMALLLLFMRILFVADFTLYKVYISTTDGRKRDGPSESVVSIHNYELNIQESGSSQDEVENELPKTSSSSFKHAPKRIKNVEFSEADLEQKHNKED